MFSLSTSIQQYLNYTVQTTTDTSCLIYQGYRTRLLLVSYPDDLWRYLSDLSGALTDPSVR